MTLEQIGNKYKISNAFLNSKEDALLVAANSLKDLQFKLDYTIPKDELKKDIAKLEQFLRDVKNSNH
jgi:hypothetical protein